MSETLYQIIGMHTVQLWHLLRLGDCVLGDSFWGVFCGVSGSGTYCHLHLYPT